MDETGEDIDAVDQTTTTPPRANAVMWIIACVLYAATLGLFALHVGLVLFEEGDFGPPPRSVTMTIVRSVVVMLGLNLLFPWALSHFPQMPEYRAPSELHALCAMCAAVSMLGYMLVIDPAGGRREFLSVTIPAVLLPVGVVVAWRAFQIGAKAVGSPSRDVSEWTATDHLLGRRRSFAPQH